MTSENTDEKDTVDHQNHFAVKKQTGKICEILSGNPAGSIEVRVYEEKPLASDGNKKETNLFNYYETTVTLIKAIIWPVIAVAILWFFYDPILLH